MERRTYLAALAAVGALGAVGYTVTQESQFGGQISEDTTATSTPQGASRPVETLTQTPEPVQVPEFGETQTYGEMSLTILDSVTESTLIINSEQLQPGEANVFLLLELIAENLGDEMGEPPRRLTYVHDSMEYDVEGSGGTTGEIESPNRTLFPENTLLGTEISSRGWVYGPIPNSLEEVTFRWEYSSYRADERDIEWVIPVPE